MHKLKIFFLVHFFTIIVFIIPSYGADVIKIGVVDTQKVLDTSLLGKKMKNELKKIHARFSADLDAKGKEIEKLQNEIEKLSASEQSLSEADKKKLEKNIRELKIKIYDAKNLEETYQNEFNNEEMNRLKYTTKIVQEIISEIGKKEGYLLIKNKRGALFSPEEGDVTDKVIKQLDSRYKEGKFKERKKKPQ
jgi:outer membrane protein